MLDRRRRSLEYALRSAEVTRWLEIQALRQGMETLRASEKLAAGRAAGADSTRGDRELGPAALHLAQDARDRARAAAAENGVSVAVVVVNLLRGALAAKMPVVRDDDDPPAAEQPAPPPARSSQGIFAFALQREKAN